MEGSSSMVGTGLFPTIVLRLWKSKWSDLLEIFDDQIREIARGLVQQAQHRAAALERELKAIETRKHEINTQLRSAQVAHDRLRSFVPIRAGDLQCPRCWVEHKTTASLRAVGGGTTHIDNFRCNSCQRDFPLRF
jgi:DNA repair exonuclease SbcCD ATPase subunit